MQSSLGVSGMQREGCKSAHARVFKGIGFQGLEISSPQEICLVATSPNYRLDRGVHPEIDMTGPLYSEILSPAAPPGHVFVRWRLALTRCAESQRCISKAVDRVNPWELEDWACSKFHILILVLV